MNRILVGIILTGTSCVIAAGCGTPTSTRSTKSIQQAISLLNEGAVKRSGDQFENAQLEATGDNETLAEWRSQYQHEIDSYLLRLTDKCESGQVSIDTASEFLKKYASEPTQRKWATHAPSIRFALANYYIFKVSSGTDMMRASTLESDVTRPVMASLKNRMGGYNLVDEKNETFDPRSALGVVTVQVHVSWDAYVDKDFPNAHDEFAVEMSSRRIPTEVGVDIEVATNKGTSSWDGTHQLVASKKNPDQLQGVGAGMIVDQMKAFKALMTQIEKQIDALPAFARKEK